MNDNDYYTDLNGNVKRWDGRDPRDVDPNEESSCLNAHVCQEAFNDTERAFLAMNKEARRLLNRDADEQRRAAFAAGDPPPEETYIERLERQEQAREEKRPWWMFPILW